MTDDLNQAQALPSDKELNFRKQQQMYERMLQEREQRIAELEQAKKIPEPEEEDDTSDPYVDHKKLNKKLAKAGQATQSEIQKAMQYAKEAAKEELKQELWLDQNPDFYDVLKLADDFAKKAPDLAKGILRMPEGFDRQKLVYHNIKAMGIDKPEQKPLSINEKIEANKKSPYYQPSGMSSAPYNASGDFSDAGKKAAHDKLQQLKKNLRLG